DSDNGTATFAKYGIVTGIPERLYTEFQSFTAKSKPTSANPEYVMFVCACKTPIAITKEIAARYRQLGIPFRCVNCASKQRELKEATRSILYETPLRDGWGRIKDKDE